MRVADKWKLVNYRPALFEHFCPKTRASLADCDFEHLGCLNMIDEDDSNVVPNNKRFDSYYYYSSYSISTLSYTALQLYDRRIVEYN